MNNNFTTKQKNWKTNPVKKIFQFGLTLLDAVPIAAAPLSHRLFDRINPPVENHRKKLEKSITQIDDDIITNRCDLENNLIDKDKYLLNLTNLESKRATTLEFNARSLRTVTVANRVFGWNTTRSFMIGFGVRLPHIVLSIALCFVCAKINDTVKYLKLALFWLQVSSVSISIYFMFWVFWTNPDFSVEVYRWVFLLFSFLLGITTVYFLFYRNALRHKLFKITDSLLGFFAESYHYMESEEGKQKYFGAFIQKLQEITKK